MCAQSYPTIWDAMDCCPLGSSVHGISQTRILEWVPFPSPGMKPTFLCLPHWQADFLPLELPWVLITAVWPKYWSFSFIISPSNEYSGLISFRMDWLDLLAVQGTLKSLLQHHSSKASILQCLTFFIVQLSHPYMTTGKAIALTRWAFVGKVMSAF